jgi:hypothetical protein
MPLNNPAAPQTSSTYREHGTRRGSPITDKSEDGLILHQFLLTVAARDDEDIEPRCLLQGGFGSKNQSLRSQNGFFSFQRM